MLVVVIILCSCLATHSGLRVSAVSALESSVNMVGRFSDDQEDDTPERTAAWEPPAKAKRGTSPSKHSPDTKWKTALYRKRPTPLMQKKVAVRYGFKCAICKQPLDETWETDHIVPLSAARSIEDADRLNP